MRRVDSCSSAASPRAVSVAATQSSAASVAGPASSATRSSQPRPPRRRRAARRGATARGRRAPRGGRGAPPRRRRRPARRARCAARRARDRLVVERDELLGLAPLDARLDEAADRRGDHLERLDHLRGGAPRGGGGVVELVREAGRHRAERGEPLAVLLDARDPAHHRRDLAHHALVDGRLREGEPPEVVGLDQRELGRPSRPACGPRAVRR